VRVAKGRRSVPNRYETIRFYEDNESQSIDFDVLSFGAEDGALNEYAVRLAPKCRRTILCLDKPALTAMATAFGLNSPVRDGTKLDANALRQAGLLDAFLDEAWERAAEAAVQG
jgi:hypothetical protein